MAVSISYIDANQMYDKRKSVLTMIYPAISSLSTFAFGVALSCPGSVNNYTQVVQMIGCCDCFSLWLVQISNYCNKLLEGHFLTFCSRYYKINTSDFLAKGVCCFRLKHCSFGCFWQNVNISAMSLLTHCISTVCPISSSNITRTIMLKFRTCMDNKMRTFVRS